MKLGRIQLHDPLDAATRKGDSLLTLTTVLLFSTCIILLFGTIGAFFGPVGVFIFLMVLLVPRVLYAILTGK